MNFARFVRTPPNDASGITELFPVVFFCENQSSSQYLCETSCVIKFTKVLTTFLDVFIAIVADNK